MNEPEGFGTDLIRSRNEAKIRDLEVENANLRRELASIKEMFEAAIYSINKTLEGVVHEMLGDDDENSRQG